jgi:hypothetical protein
MTEIPKVVRQRLAASAKPGVHPDPDLLTAFAEQALPIRERNSVLAHLSQCAGCREVVIMAAPQVKGAIQEIPTRSAWLGWPALRWGVLAACAVVVVAAVSLRPKFEPPPAASKEASPQVAARLAEPAPEEKISAADKFEKDRATMQSAPRDLAKSSARMNVPQVSRAEAPIAVPARKDEVAVSSGMLAASPAENEPAAPSPAAMAGASTAAPSSNEQISVNAETAAVAAKTAESSLGKAKQAAGDEILDSKSQRAMARSELASPATANSVAQYAYKKVIPRWTLSADGTLQRSLDAGKSWKTIPVAADATFTAVAAMASDIWVGGSHGALYHSVDAGEHWTQVTPSAGGQPLTSNIIGIEFTDSLHGRITTSNQEIWTTSDGGGTWEASH